ncbi:MAG: phage portal protein [bacterium]|nr:phage portal protein [bacterium]
MMRWPWKRKQVEAYEPSRQQTFHHKKTQRNFIAAQTDRLVEGWATQPTSINQAIKAELSTLRQRSRDLARNNAYGRRFIRLVQQNVVGHRGVQVQAQVPLWHNPKKQDGLANDAIEQAYVDWGKYHCEVTGRYSFLSIQNLFISTVARDGEFLAIEHYGVGKYGYQLQLMDPELIDTDATRPEVRGHQVRLGIEYDKRGRKYAYHFRAQDAEGNIIRAPGYVVPSSRVIHEFLPDEIGQERGIPWMAAGMRNLKQLDGYLEAAVVAARIGASKMGFFTRDDADAKYGDGVDSDGNQTIEVEPGMLETVDPGITGFHTFDPDYPHAQFEAFTKTCLRGIGAGWNVGYNNLGNDLEGVNYSSLRSGALEERETWKAIQEWMIDAFIRPVYLKWLMYAVMSQSIKIGRTPLARPYFDYEAAKFQARRWDWVDPVKDLAAQEKAIELGLKSRSEIIREQGRDPNEVWREIKKEKDEMKSLGLDPPQTTETEKKPAKAGFLMPGENEDETTKAH